MKLDTLKSPYAVSAIKNLENTLPVVSSFEFRNETNLNVNYKHLIVSATILKKHINYQFNVLSCVSGVDTLDNLHRFLVVYDLLSIPFSNRIRIKCAINETTPIDSLTSVYVNANWWEREVWDMFGIYFNNHPDLRRILTDYGFEGYPLRKDFPLSGHIETRYDAIKGKVVLEDVQIQQEFRNFNQNAI